MSKLCKRTVVCTIDLERIVIGFAKTARQAEGCVCWASNGWNGVVVHCDELDGRSNYAAAARLYKFPGYYVYANWSGDIGINRIEYDGWVAAIDAVLKLVTYVATAWEGRKWSGYVYKASS